MPHPDKDRWKHTMFTDKILSVCSCNKTSLVYIYIYNMTLYNIIIINNNHSYVQEEKKFDNIVHSELYGSSRLARKFNFSP